MASLRSQALQSLIRGRSPLLRFPQRRWAQVHDVRFLATHHDPNHVLEKYQSKLDQKAKQCVQPMPDGHGSVESLKDAYKEKIQNLREKASTAATPEAPAPASDPSSHSAVPPPPQAQQPSPNATKAGDSGPSNGIKPLDSFIDVEKVAGLPPKEIEALWRLRHISNPHSICAVVPKETYERIVATARQNPQFVLPVPRTVTEEQPAADKENGEPTTATKQGAEIHFLQWGFHPPASPPPVTASPGQLANAHTSTVLFTHLAAYQAHGAYAQPHTTITNYLDLADSKGLVLMVGQVMPDTGVTSQDASWLVSCLQRFYDFGGQASEKKGNLVRMFNRGDIQNFKLEDLLEETEKL